MVLSTVEDFNGDNVLVVVLNNSFPKLNAIIEGSILENDKLNEELLKSSDVQQALNYVTCGDWALTKADLEKPIDYILGTVNTKVVSIYQVVGSWVKLSEDSKRYRCIGLCNKKAKEALNRYIGKKIEKTKFGADVRDEYYFIINK